MSISAVQGDQERRRRAGAELLAALLLMRRRVPRGINGSRYWGQIDAEIGRAVRRYADLMSAVIDRGASAAATRSLHDLQVQLRSAAAALRAESREADALALDAAADRLSVHERSISRGAGRRSGARTHKDGMMRDERIVRVEYELRLALKDAARAEDAVGRLALGAAARRTAAWKMERIRRTEAAGAARDAVIYFVTEGGPTWSTGASGSVRTNGRLIDGVAALGWRLSPMHPAVDICDFWASDTSDGLGPGNYLPGTVPPGHPNCLCSVVAVPVGAGAYYGVTAEPDAGSVPLGQIRYYAQRAP